MAFKKVLAGVGIVCLLAPLAAMARSDSGSFVARTVAQAMSGLGLVGLLPNGEQAQEQETALPSRLATDTLDARMSRMLMHVAGMGPLVGDEGSDLSEDDPVAAAMSGGIGGSATTRSQTGLRVAQAGQPGGAVPAGGAAGVAGGGGASGAAAIGGGGGLGSGSGDGNRAPQLAAAEAGPLGESPRDPRNGAVTEVPVPASVWMLLASIAGLAMIGHRRRSRPV